MSFDEVVLASWHDEGVGELGEKKKKHEKQKKKKEKSYQHSSTHAV